MQRKFNTQNIFTTKIYPFTVFPPLCITLQILTRARLHCWISLLHCNPSLSTCVGLGQLSGERMADSTVNSLWGQISLRRTDADIPTPVLSRSLFSSLLLVKTVKAAVFMFFVCLEALNTNMAQDRVYEGLHHPSITLQALTGGCLH